MEISLYHDFARLEDKHWWFQGRRAVLRAALRRWLAPSAGLKSEARRRILDAGCGTGAMLEMLQEFGQVEGMDTSPEALDYCRRRLGDQFPLHHGILPNGIPPGATYDLITAFDVIEHIPEAVPALRAMRAALRPGGALVCTVPAYQFLWSAHDEMNHHCRRYTRRLLTAHLTEAGFAVRRISYFNTLLFPPIACIRLTRRLLIERRKTGAYAADGSPKHQTNNGSMGASDCAETPVLLNALFRMVFSAEQFVCPVVPFPFGVSLVALALPKETS